MSQLQRESEIKVLFVGDGGAGKTSLRRRLQEAEFSDSEPQTRGIDINRWTVPLGTRRVRLNLWDFGGQEVLHATHQFFLSDRSVYVLVLDGRKEEDAEYWLKYIESFGGESPTLIVLNKMDENPSFDVNRRFLRSRYREIIGFHRISCKDSTGVDLLKNALLDVVSSAPLLRAQLPGPWFQVKARLERTKEPFISYEHYQDMCAEFKLVDESAQATLLGFLNDLGVAIRFSDFRLKNTQVLNPRWITDGVYRIINSGTLADNRGLLDLRRLAEDLKPRRQDEFAYSLEGQAYLVDLMEKFELCFPVDQETYLVPSLLEIDEPEFVFDYASSLCFHIDYDFLPPSVLPRFMVRRFRDIASKLRWRTGMVLIDSAIDAEAVVRSDRQARRIEIHVSGKQKRSYLTIIRSTLRDINRNSSGTAKVASQKS